jgi:phosphatidylserine decarboxylase
VLVKGRQNSLVAREGIPILLLALFATGMAGYYAGWLASIFPAIVLIALIFLFRDPRRIVPSQPLAVVSPVDGVVVEVTVVDDGIVNLSAHKIVVRVDSFGTYTARSPVEGTILDYRNRTNLERRDTESPGLWLRTDEGDDVVLLFGGHRFGLVPRALSRYGERVGQGQRCAFLRLTRFAEIYIPVNSRVLVEPGHPVIAGSDILGTLPHH